SHRHGDSFGNHFVAALHGVAKKWAVIHVESAGGSRGTNCQRDEENERKAEHGQSFRDFKKSFSRKICVAEKKSARGFATGLVRLRSMKNIRAQVGQFLADAR